MAKESMPFELKRPDPNTPVTNATEIDYADIPLECGLIYDISVAHAVNNVPAQYESLSAALGTSGANIPQEVRRGGMAVKFINSGTGKYEQWNLKASSFSTTESDWVNITNAEVSAENVSYGQSNVKVKLDSLTEDIDSLDKNKASVSLGAEGDNLFDYTHGYTLGEHHGGTDYRDTSNRFTTNQYIKVTSGTTLYFYVYDAVGRKVVAFNIFLRTRYNIQKEYIDRGLPTNQSSYTPDSDGYIRLCIYATNPSQYAESTLPNIIVSKRNDLANTTDPIPYREQKKILDSDIEIPFSSQSGLESETQSAAIDEVNEKVNNYKVKFTPYNFDISDINIIDIKGKFYGERAATHAKYVSDNSKTIYLSTLNGSDTNDGLSASSAVRTLTKAYELLVDGDTLLIERGSIFTDVENVSKNGLIIDCYGDVTKPRPTAYNLIDITDASVIEKVSGYNNIYRVAWQSNAATGSDRAAIQVFVDDKACGDWTIYTKYTPSAYDVITEQGAMAYLDANVNNAAWCSAYINNGFANGWNAGTYYIYFSVDWDATDQTALNAHKLQITRQVGQLVQFNGVDNDLRNFVWQTLCFNVCAVCRFNEYVELHNFVRHGFHYTNSWFANCVTETLEGIGKHYHYQPQSDSSNYEELILVNCKAISHRSDKQGELFDGHGTNTTNPVITYRRAFVENCYAENLAEFISGANIRNIYIKNCCVNGVARIGTFYNDIVIDGMYGYLNEYGVKTALIQPPTSGHTAILRNIHINMDSEKSGAFLVYSINIPPSNWGNIVFDNCVVLIKKLVNEQATTELGHTFGFWDGNAKYTFKNTIFGVVHSDGTKDNFKRESDSSTPFANMVIDNAIFVGIINNTAELEDAIWLDDFDQLKAIEYLPRMQYVADGELKMVKI